MKVATIVDVEAVEVQAAIVGHVFDNASVRTTARLFLPNKDVPDTLWVVIPIKEADVKNIIKDKARGSLGPSVQPRSSEVAINYVPLKDNEGVMAVGGSTVKFNT